MADEKAAVANGKDKDDEVSLDQFTVIETDDQGRPLKSDNEKTGAAEDTVQAHDDDDDDDERTALADDDQKKELRRNRREKRRLAVERDRLQIQKLTEINETLLREVGDIRQRQGAQETGQLHQRLSDAKQRVQSADAIMLDALKNNQHERYIKAVQVRDEAIYQFRSLSELAGRVENEGRRQPVTRNDDSPTPSRLPPAIQDHVDSFAARHSWYDPKGLNAESRIVLALDESLAEEGYDPATPAYWTELDKRVARSLPHRNGGRAADAGGQRQQNGQAPGRRSPPVGGSGSQDISGSGGRRAVYISPERKQAMIDAGKWDDPKSRARMLKYYAEQDARDATTSKGARQ